MSLRRSLFGLLVPSLIACALSACTSDGKTPRPDLQTLSVQAAEMLRSAARDLGRESVGAAGKPSTDAIRRYLDVVARTGATFGGPLLVRDTSSQPKVTPVAVLGLELTVADVAKALPGGVKYPDAATRQVLEKLDVRSEEKRLRRLGRADLEATFDDNIRLLLLLSLFTDENLSLQLVPPGSTRAAELAQKGFVGEHGKVMVPAPPIDQIDIAPWGTFYDAVTRGPTFFSSIQYEATLRGGFPE